MRFRRQVLLTFALSSFMFAGCARHDADPRTQPAVVRLFTVGDADDAGESFTGVVTARVQSDLGFRVPGKVTRRFVDAGQKVRAGQPLMRIDVTDYEHAITNEAKKVEAARARASQAAADEARYHGLVGTGAVSASAYDQVKAAADAAAAELAAAETQEKIAKDQGDYSLLVADADGTVVETLAEPGQVVAAGQLVVKLAHAGPREAAVYLPETIRPALGSIGRASLYGGGTQSVLARLRQLSDSADPVTRTFEARYVLGGSDAKAPLGATVTIHLEGSSATTTLEVPNASITDGGSGPGVWIFDKSNSKVSFRPVKVLRLSGESTFLEGDIHPGEQIVALGAHLLTEGQRVRAEQNETASR